MVSICFGFCSKQWVRIIGRNICQNCFFLLSQSTTVKEASKRGQRKEEEAAKEENFEDHSKIGAEGVQVGA